MIFSLLSALIAGGSAIAGAAINKSAAEQASETSLGLAKIRRKDELSQAATQNKFSEEQLGLSKESLGFQKDEAKKDREERKQNEIMKRRSEFVDRAAGMLGNSVQLKNRLVDMYSKFGFTGA